LGKQEAEEKKMKCPKCQTENPEGMKFYGNCGDKLERACPNQI
jgi:hypothetical protein